LPTDRIKVIPKSGYNKCEISISKDTFTGLEFGEIHFTSSTGMDRTLKLTIEPFDWALRQAQDELRTSFADYTDGKLASAVKGILRLCSGQVCFEAKKRGWKGIAEIT
jgi:hypothetical protein